MSKIGIQRRDMRGYCGQIQKAVTDSCLAVINDKLKDIEEAKKTAVDMQIMKTQLETEMKNAEYNYQVSSIENKNVFTFDELTVLEKQLNDEVLIFQPVNINGDEVTNVDMNSLAQALTNLRDDGKITQNILVLPQNVNVFKAVLKRPDNNSDDENVT